MRLEELEEVVYRDVPSVLVLADSEEGLRRSCDAIEGAGYRVSGRSGLTHAVERLKQQASADTVFVDVMEDHEQLDDLLDALNLAASASGQRSVINAPAALIDPISSRLSQSGIWHLCDAEHEEVLDALTTACAPPPQRLNEVDKGQDPLQQLSEEVVRISERLSRLSGEAGARDAPPAKGSTKEQPVTAASIRALIRARRAREQFFPAGMFADPAWDMLLDLMAANFANLGAKLLQMNEKDGSLRFDVLIARQGQMASQGGGRGEKRRAKCSVDAAAA